ncbi:Protein of unknown function [Gryllus bimaculatus]|nr:Protein of unknown function [Gryllus bimaculatus]
MRPVSIVAPGEYRCRPFPAQVLLAGQRQVVGIFRESDLFAATGTTGGPCRAREARREDALVTGIAPHT